MYGNIVLGVCVLILFSDLSAQDKRDYYWPFAIDRDTFPGTQGFEFDFTKTPFAPERRNAGLAIDQMNGSICDRSGNLLFYTNGCAVANRLHQVMPNGDSLNWGKWYDERWVNDCSFGYPGAQDIMILPDPGTSDGYYLIHKPVTSGPQGVPTSELIDTIKYSYVDMTLDGGHGAVVEKNVTFYEQGLLYDYLTAIQHANGRDWWIINPIFPSGYVIILLSEEGFSSVKELPGPVWDDFYSSSSGFARFSPDGRHYAYFNQYDGLYLYDFDRTIGELTDEANIGWNMPEQGVFAAMEWGPGSRFVYLSNFDTLWQVDTHMEPLQDGLEFIAAREQMAARENPFFQIMALGPDCRIYVRGNSSAINWHVIHNPDQPGAACNFEQRAIALPYVSSAGSFPNFPRFRVDEEEKCDPGIVSIFGDDIYWRRDLSVYPNPVVDRLTVELPEQKRGTLYVMDMAGQMLMSEEVMPGTLSQQLSLGSFPAGTYSVEFIPVDNKERRVWTSQVVVVGGG